MAARPSGFALRTSGECLADEVDCGATTAPYRACCPHDLFCPTSWNVDCCPTKDNCTAAIVEKPKCANETWDLYDNGAYFCCLNGLKGYSTAGGRSDGCAASGHQFSDGDTILDLVSAGLLPSSSTSAITSSSTTLSTSASATSPTTQPTTQPTFPDPVGASKSNTGAYVGGVLGGVAGVALVAVGIWLVLRKRLNDKKKSAYPQDAHEVSGSQPSPVGKINELPTSHGASELPG